MKDKEIMKQWLPLILIAVLSYWTVNNTNIIIGILTKILKVLWPFILGAIIAFILNIPMSKIETALNKRIKNKKVPVRIIAITGSLLILVLVIAFVLFLLIPEVIENIKTLIDALPSLINNVEIWIINLLDKYPDIQTNIRQMFETNSLDKIIPDFLNYMINGTINFISNIISGIITLFTATVFSIYMLSQKEYLLRGIKKLMNAYLKAETVTKLTEIGQLSNQIFTKFISGQCVEAAILGSIFFVVLSIFRFPYALIISVLTTITALIPIFGALIAMVIGAILIAITNPFQALIFIIVFQIIQQIEGNFIYPRVVGKSVGLSPMWTLFAISAGGSLFGIIGMLVSLPLASILYALLRSNVNKKIKTK